MNSFLLFTFAALAVPIQGFGTVPLRVSRRSLGCVVLFADDAAAYRKGGNARYQSPVVNPARLDQEEDCEEPFIDHATGDEL